MSTTDPARTPAREEAAGPPADPEILAERRHLAAARDALRAMHESVAATALVMSGDAKDRFNDAALRRGRERRLAELADIPDAPLFFGRLDFDPGTVFLDDGDEGSGESRGKDHGAGGGAGDRAGKPRGEGGGAGGTESPGGRGNGQGPPGTGPGRTGDRSDEGPDRVHIGRRHVHDADGRPMVLDWRAPISVAYYRATAGDRMRARSRRRYGFTTVPAAPDSRPEGDSGPGRDAAAATTAGPSGAAGAAGSDGAATAAETAGAAGPTAPETFEAVLTAYEDEPLTADGAGAEVGEHTGDLLADEIERPRSGPMRDIVATIQPEQDDLVRAPLSTTLCVQGAPGTGKTAVGLHRVAYLLYTERERLSRTGVSVVGPNRSFLSYIRNVLPALGEVDVGQTTVEELVESALPERSRPTAGWVRRTEPPEAARIKGEARMAEVLRRDLWSHLRPPEEALMVREGARRLRLYPEDLRPLLDELAGRGVSYGAGRDLLSHRIAHAILSLMESEGYACDDRTHERVRRDPAVRRAVTDMWPKADPLKLVLGLLTDPERLARAADGLLTPEEQAPLMLPGKPRGPKSAKWSREDLVLVDEAAALIERGSGLGHVVVDEAQDLSPMQCRAVGRRGAGGSFTVLGDVAQGTSPGATRNWSTLLEHLGRPTGHLSVLERGYRVPAQIIDFAARLLPTIAPGLGAPVAVRRAPGALRLTPAPDGLAAPVAEACRSALAGQGSVGLIAADADLPDLCAGLSERGLHVPVLGEDGVELDSARLVAVPASLAKGLEFDAVVVAEPASIAGAEPRGRNRLYVVLTRAVSSLHVVHARPLPDELA